VDVLALREEVGPALAPLLADPGVVKVLHGADHDVVWLQVGKGEGGGGWGEGGSWQGGVGRKQATHATQCELMAAVW
jgi:hypothetical protein